MEKFKQILSLALCLCMLLSMLPGIAMAEGEDTTEIFAEIPEMEAFFEAEVPDSVAEEIPEETEEKEFFFVIEVEGEEEPVLNAAYEEIPGQTEEATEPEEILEEAEEEAEAEESLDAYSGSCGYNVSWSLSDSGVLTISGTGNMKNYYYSDVPWYNYRTSITRVSISSGITSLGDYCFSSCSSLTSITIPNSVTSLGWYCFFHCSSLTSITIPESVTSVGPACFFGCDSLTSITLPNSVTYLGGSCFADCRSLTSITIPSSVTYLDCFYNCSSLTSITIPSSVTYLGDDCFYNCSSLTSITIPNSVTSLGEGCFGNCSSLTSITIPESVTSLGDNCFQYCSRLTSITIPESVTSLGNYCFQYCSRLTSITIPESVTSLGNRCFEYCSSLTSITIPESVTSLGNYCFEYCSSLTSITIPESVTSLEYSCFAFCSSLTSITIPNSVTYLGDDCFEACTGLKSIIFLGNAPELGAHVFERVQASVYYDPAMEGWDDVIGNDFGGTLTYYYSKVNTPVITSAANAAAGVTVKWNAVPGASKYRVFYKTGTGSWKAAVNTAATSATVTGLISGTKYSFTVRCLNAEGTGYVSSYDTVGKNVTYVAAPTISSLTNASNGVTVKWAAVPGAVNYRVFYKTGTGSWTGFGNTTGTSATVTGLTSGTKYSFTIRCVSADGKTFISSYDNTGKSITYTPTQLATPVISSVANAVNGVTVKWGAVSGAVNYRVFYKVGSGSWTKAADTASTSYTVTGLTSGTKYSFTVRCVSADGKTFTSSYDNIGKSITYTKTQLATPVISSVANAVNGVTVKWGAVSGAAQYRVFIKSGTSWKTMANTTATSATITGLTSGTKYTFTVRCLSADGKSYTSSFDTTGKSITYLAAPTLTSVTKSGSSGVIVQWNTVPGAVNYRVFYKTGSGSWVSAGNSTSPIFIVDNLKAGTTYSFTVRCLSADGKSYTSAYNATGLSITR